MRELWASPGEAWARPGRARPAEAWQGLGKAWARLGWKARLPQNQVDSSRNALRVALAGTWLTLDRQLEVLAPMPPLGLKVCQNEALCISRAS